VKNVPKAQELTADESNCIIRIFTICTLNQILREPGAEIA
jgi:hypothetical protein